MMTTITALMKLGFGVPVEILLADLAALMVS